MKSDSNTNSSQFNLTTESIPDERDAAADAEPAQEPPDDEGVLGACEGWGEAAGKVDDHGDDEGLAAAVHVPEAAPDVAPDEHAQEHDGADDALVGRREAELAAGRQFNRKILAWVLALKTDWDSTLILLTKREPQNKQFKTQEFCSALDMSHLWRFSHCRESQT